jgi:sulfatase-like protein
MAEQVWQTIACQVALGLAGSFALELLLKPRPVQPWQRPCKAIMVHLGIWLLMYAPLLFLLRRPWFASAGLLVLMLSVILISNAKYRSLREPFIYQDFSYFVDALRYPRLYLPFLGLLPGGMAMLAVMVTITTGLLLEQPVGLLSAGAGSAVTALAGAGLIALGSRGGVRLLLSPEKDLTHLGLLPSLWHYALLEQHPWQGQAAQCFTSASPDQKAELPNLMVIQSESFIDPRRWVDEISPELLSNFDDLRQSAVSHGWLEVPAWGANTVRTEFAFLSGIANDKLGIHRFKPYRRLAYQGVPTLAGFLKKLGYRTVCLHPYSAGFYGRDKVFPLLGFDEFIDISTFAKSDYVGQYVGDAAVAREACRELALHESHKKSPVFLFVITMENHGPLHLEEAGSEDRQRFYTNDQPRGCDELTVYLRHLEQADRMLGMVRHQLESMERCAWLCLYGDHPPIMPEVYRRLGAPDNSVDYLVWSNRQQATSRPSPLRAEQLSGLLVQVMGLAAPQEERLQPDAGSNG